MEIERPFGLVVVPDIFDSSIIGDNQACPRYYYWRHVRGAEIDTPNIAPHFGTCIHAAIEMHYLLYEKDLSVENLMHALTIMMPPTNDEKLAYTRLREAFKEIMESEDPVHAACMIAFDWNWQDMEGDAIRNRNTAEVLVRRYRGYYRTEPFTLMEPREKYLEVGFTYHLFGNIYYFGRIDMVVEWVPYGIVPIDHKTSRNLGKNKFLEFNPFFQGEGYLGAARHHWDRVGAICVNVLQTAKTKHGLERFVEPRTDDHIEAWYSDAVDWVSEILERFEKWRWPRDKGGYGGYCTHWGACQFRSLCVSLDYMTVEQCDRQPIPGGYVESRWEPWESAGEITTRVERGDQHDSSQEKESSGT